MEARDVGSDDQGHDPKIVVDLGVTMLDEIRVFFQMYVGPAAADSAAADRRRRV